MHASVDAAVIVPEIIRVARPTVLAVEELVTATDSADPAVATVKDLLLLVLVIEEIADRAEVFTKLRAASLTILLNLLGPDPTSTSREAIGQRNSL